MNKGFADAAVFYGKVWAVFPEAVRSCRTVRYLSL